MATLIRRRRPIPIRRRARRRPSLPRLREHEYRFTIAEGPSGGYVELVVPGESDTLTARAPSWLGSPGTRTGAMVHFSETRVSVAAWVA